MNAVPGVKGEGLSFEVTWSGFLWAMPQAPSPDDSAKPQQ